MTKKRIFAILKQLLILTRMPKIKTHKATAKRVQVKRTKKGITATIRTGGQDHFNARESGKTKRNKRSDKPLPAGFMNRVKKAVPYV